MKEYELAFWPDLTGHPGNILIRGHFQSYPRVCHSSFSFQPTRGSRGQAETVGTQNPAMAPAFWVSSLDGNSSIVMGDETVIFEMRAGPEAFGLGAFATSPSCSVV